jgi:altronate dehydratase small subunit
MTWHALVLNEKDHVAVVLRPVAAGHVIVVKFPSGLIELTVSEAIPLCHKLALRDIAAGEPVMRYGQCIGEARMAITRGGWVHIHNLVSRRAGKNLPARADINLAAYLDTAADAIKLTVPSAARAAVLENLAQLGANAQLLMTAGPFDTADTESGDD